MHFQRTEIHALLKGKGGAFRSGPISRSGTGARTLLFGKAWSYAAPVAEKYLYEIHSDLGIDFDMSVGELTDWARQGVLMLNTSLTVREGMAGSHRGKGWEILTDRIIELLNERDVPTAFILWGNNAKSKMPLITNPKHAVFTAAHPSPLSAYNGFFGCRHFSKVNEFLKSNGIEPIDWSIH